jgi:hypothetical protein
MVAQFAFSAAATGAETCFPQRLIFALCHFGILSLTAKL